MASSSIVLALIVVAVFLLGLFIGSRHGRSNQQKLAEARETGLLTQLENASSEIAALRPRSEELTRVQEQLKHEQARYMQMKADLDLAFKGAAAEALRSNTESFLALAKQELGGQARDARQTLEAKELAIKNLLDPLGAQLKSLDEKTSAMEKERAGAYGQIKAMVEASGGTFPSPCAPFALKLRS
jgi:DNA recombination protein RmuC